MVRQDREALDLLRDTIAQLLRICEICRKRHERLSERYYCYECGRHLCDGQVQDGRHVNCAA